MGILKQGIFGPYQGTTGNVTGSFWKGRNVLKIRAASHSDANTLLQENQRMKFTLVNDFVTQNLDLVRIGFSAASGSSTSFNKAVKYNLMSAITGEFPNLKLDLTLAKISLGDLPNLKKPVLTMMEGNTLKIEWTDISGTGHAESTDNVFLSIMTEEGDEVFINDTVIKRGDTSALISLPEKLAGKNVVVFGFTASAKVMAVAKKKGQVSNSGVYGSIERRY